MTSRYAAFSAISCLWIGVFVGCDDSVKPATDDVDTRIAEYPPDTPDVADGQDDGDTLIVTVPEPYPGVVRIELEVDRRAWEHMEANAEDSIEIEARATIDGTVFDDVECEIHGGYARQLPKKSYRCKLPDDVDLPVDLFGDGAEKQRRFVLKSSYIDMSYLREKLTLDLVRAAGGLAPRATFADLVVNGTWHGLFVLIERIDRPYLKRQGFESDDVQLYKAEDHNANWFPKTNPLLGYDIQLGETSQAADLSLLLDAVGHTPTTEEAFAESVEPILSLDDFMIWQMVHTFADNQDTFTKNYYLYHDLTAAAGTPEARFRIISWDGDATFGNQWDGSVLPANSEVWYGTDRFAPRLFSIPAWKERYRAAYRAALDGTLAAAPLEAKARALAEMIAPAAARDLARWNRTGSLDDELERLVAAIKRRTETMTEVLSR